MIAAQSPWRPFFADFLSVPGLLLGLGDSRSLPLPAGGLLR
jgi:hypothetical protein